MKPASETLQHAPPKTAAELAPFIDHTLLKADATESMIERLCLEAVQYKFHAVCVNSAHVAYARGILLREKERLGTKFHPVHIASVVGFPLGAMTAQSKAFEASEAAKNGATEIDMVMRIDLAKTGDFGRLSDDIASVVQSVEGKAIVKVILETGLLTLEEIARSSRAADAAGAHFVKTCTGFSTAGFPAGAATTEHVALMRESVRPSVQVKASGGVKTFEAARALILAGADRIGTSSGVALVTGQTPGAGY
ncbi:MAG: deoxyribose-phosphate aldolase [Bdellovibrionales bacterium]|jgi:deoxyribose-phosphate aldolase|nr:deoxyribose-phosphate aldolase [Bdellovibrionales bacterium]